MLSRLVRFLMIALVVALAHAGILLSLRWVKAGRAATASAAIQASFLPASEIKYSDTRVRIGETPARGDLPSLPAPKVTLSPQFLPMSAEILQGAGLGSAKQIGPPDRLADAPQEHGSASAGVQGSVAEQRQAVPTFVAMARRKPPGFAQAAQPGIGVLKGHERLAGHLREVTRQGLDVVFVFDSTESMVGVISQVKEKIKFMMQVLSELVPGFRVGMVAYRDYAAEYTTKPLPPTNDLQDVFTYIEDVRVGMGFRTPAEVGKEDIQGSEAVYTALNEAIGFRWRPSAKKVIILIGDAPPHPEEVEETLAVARSFWKSGQGVIHTLYTPPETHDARSPTEFIKPEMRRYFTDKELKTLMQLGQKKPPSSASQAGRKIEETFRDIALNGGGECVRLGSDKEIVREMLTSALGRQWRGELDEIYAVLKDRVPK